jgi:hypothetical protein
MTSESDQVPIERAKMADFLRAIRAEYYSDESNRLGPEFLADVQPAKRKTIARLLNSEQGIVNCETVKGVANLIDKAPNRGPPIDGNDPNRKERERAHLRRLFYETLGNETVLRVEPDGRAHDVVSDVDEESDRRAADEIKRLISLTDVDGNTIGAIVEELRYRFPDEFANLRFLVERIGETRVRLAELEVVTPLFRAQTLGSSELDISELSQHQLARFVKLGVELQTILLGRSGGSARRLETEHHSYRRFVRHMDAVRARASTRDPSEVKCEDPVRSAPVPSERERVHSWYVLKDGNGNIIEDDTGKAKIAPERRSENKPVTQERRQQR